MNAGSYIVCYRWRRSHNHGDPGLTLSGQDQPSLYHFWTENDRTERSILVSDHPTCFLLAVCRCPRPPWRRGGWWWWWRRLPGTRLSSRCTSRCGPRAPRGQDATRWRLEEVLPDTWSARRRSCWHELSGTRPDPCQCKEQLKHQLAQISSLPPSLSLLTVFVSAEVRFGLGRGIWLSSLVDSDHSELVPLAFTQAGHASLQLVNGGDTVLVVSDESIKPTSELVFLLDDVVADRPATIALWFLPPQRDGFVVKVDDLWFTRLAGRSWNTQCQSGPEIGETWWYSL